MIKQHASPEIGLKAQTVNFVIQHKYPSMLVGLLTIWILAALLFHLFENLDPAHTAYRSFGHSMWAIIVYLTSGLDEAPPASLGGKVTAILVLLAGVVVVGGITACLTSDLVHNVMRGTEVPEKPRRLSLRHHIVIFGMTRSTDRVVRELHHVLVGTERHLVIVAPDGVTVPLGDPRAYRHVHCVHGDFTDEEVLARAGVDTAETVIILASEGGDEAAVLVCLAVGMTHPDAHVIVEVDDADNERHLHRTRADEVVYMDSVEMMAQCALTHDVSSVFEELLTNQEDGNEIYLIPLPESLHRRTFADVALELLEQQVLLIGVVRAEGERSGDASAQRSSAPRFELNPPPERQLLRGESLVTIAFSRPEL